jgi:transposase
LHQGHFHWPKPGDDQFLMSAEHWQWLITGVDWQRLCAKPQGHWLV